MLTHIRNPLKPECKEFVLSGALPPLTVQDLQRFDAEDAAAIRAARKEGYTHPKVVKAAVNQKGARM